MDEIVSRAVRRRTLPDPATRTYLRVRSGLSLAEVAQACGVSAPAVCRWEKGTRTPSGEARERYCELLDRLRQLEPGGPQRAA